MNKRHILVANFKSNPDTSKEAIKISKDIAKVRKTKKLEVVICPSYLHIPHIRKAIGRSKVSIGSQDLSSFDGGSHTGDVSSIMLRDEKVSYTIIGHSERRKMGESSKDVSKKVKRAIEDKITPIVCLGETNRNKKYLEELEKEIRESLDGLVKSEILKLIIAYEPVWAVGADDAINNRELYSSIIFVRKIIAENYGRDVSFSIPIVYGGSVNSQNILQLLETESVNGLLVGRASLDKKEFKSMIEIFSDYIK